VADRRAVDRRDLLAGLMFVAFGGGALLLSGAYAAGSAARMGPGYFPRLLGVLLVVLGAVLCLRGLRAARAVHVGWHWRPLLVVLAAVAAFSFTARWLGLALSGLLLVFIASSASPEFRWKEALLSGALLGAAAAAVFVWGLGMPLPVLPTFLGGG